MIESYADDWAKLILEKAQVPKGFPHDIAKATRRKLLMLDEAEALDDLRNPPGNRLEALKGNYEGFYSIRINNQWRIVFKFEGKNPSLVEIIDYH